MCIGVGGVCDEHFVYACAYDCGGGSSADWYKKKKCACSGEYFCLLCAMSAFGSVLSCCEMTCSCGVAF